MINKIRGFEVSICGDGIGWIGVGLMMDWVGGIIDGASFTAASAVKQGTFGG
jgi:hypothetical protein